MNEMKDLPASRIDEVKDLIKHLNPDMTIFYYNGLYHAVKNNWLTEISAEEAEQCLKTPDFDLWHIKTACTLDEPLPERNPSWIYRTIHVTVPVGEFLQRVFDLYNKEYIFSKLSNN